MTRHHFGGRELHPVDREKLVKHRIVGILATAVLLSIAGIAKANHERLLIELLPVPIWAGLSEVWTSGIDSGRAESTAAMLAVHEAMLLLKVNRDEFDVVWHPDSHLLWCTYGTTQFISTCSSFQSGSEVVLSADEMRTLPQTLGYNTRPQGKILLAILLKTPGFPWDGGLLGRASVSTWTGWDPQDMHWSTMSCLAWSHVDVLTIAHELGHCFGLVHNDSVYANLDGADDTIDLMAANVSRYRSDRLKPSNQERIWQNFRFLGATPFSSQAPLTITVE